ncbi:cytochrome c [Rhodobacterales bacterium HKCCE2091]|nr:cytochrome c [Rhodobacterales bacterium HKCCE2091]
MRMILTTATALAAVLSCPDGARAQDAAMTALTSHEDATIARRLLMNAIGANNDAIHDMLDGVIENDPYVLEGRLAAISAMMRAFPGLYRAEPNPYSEDAAEADPFTVSLALPSVWEDFEGFEALALDAWQTALDASIAPRDEVLELVEVLESQCESCHAAYRVEFEFFDFDSLPAPDAD